MTAVIGSAIGGSFIDTVVQPKNLERWLDGDKTNGIAAVNLYPHLLRSSKKAIQIL